MPRARHDYIPRADAEFAAWVNAYAVAMVGFWNAQGFPSTDLKPLKNAVDAFGLAYEGHVAAQAAAEGARAAKEQARETLEKIVRPLTAYVQALPATTDADRAELGITVRTSSPARNPAPTTRPLVSVEGGTRLTHELRLVDERTPTRRGKPAGVAGAEVWLKLVDPPLTGSPTPTDPLGDPKTFSFLTLTTRPSLRTDFPTAAGGKTAVYMLRWVNTRGEKGPWSDVATATVAA